MIWYVWAAYGIPIFSSNTLFLFFSKFSCLCYRILSCVSLSNEACFSLFYWSNSVVVVVGLSSGMMIGKKLSRFVIPRRTCRGKKVFNLSLVFKASLAGLRACFSCVRIFSNPLCITDQQPYELMIENFPENLNQMNYLSFVMFV